MIHNILRLFNCTYIPYIFINIDSYSDYISDIIFIILHSTQCKITSLTRTLVT